MSIKHVTAALGAVALGAIASVAGMITRDYADAGFTSRPVVAERPLNKLVASLDKGNVSDDINEVTYFNQIAELLRMAYVDPIQDDTKLATGATRGMILSLNDTDSQFFMPDQFKCFKSQAAGQYRGIGVDMALVNPTQIDETKVAKIPRLVIAAVAPGGPADRAGLKPGDVIDTVDSHWILNSNEIQDFRNLQVAASKDASKAEAFKTFRRELRAKSAKAILPNRAIERLWSGTDGSISLVVIRGKESISTTLQKRITEVPSVSPEGAVFRVHLAPGVGGILTKTLPKQGEVTLDLRNNVTGDQGVLVDALTALAGPGTFGKVVCKRTDKRPVVIKTVASAVTRTYKLLVDSSTKAAASALVSALRAKGLARVEGTPHADKTLTETVELPDGSGYTLNLGSFQAEGAR